MFWRKFFFQEPNNLSFKKNATVVFHHLQAVRSVNLFPQNTLSCFVAIERFVYPFSVIEPIKDFHWFSNFSFAASAITAFRSFSALACSFCSRRRFISLWAFSLAKSASRNFFVRFGWFCSRYGNGKRLPYCIWSMQRRQCWQVDGFRWRR